MGDSFLFFQDDAVLDDVAHDHQRVPHVFHGGVVSELLYQSAQQIVIPDLGEKPIGHHRDLKEPHFFCLGLAYGMRQFCLLLVLVVEDFYPARRKVFVFVLLDQLLPDLVPARQHFLHIIELSINYLRNK